MIVPFLGKKKKGFWSFKLLWLTLSYLNVSLRKSKRLPHKLKAQVLSLEARHMAGYNGSHV